MGTHAAQSPMKATCHFCGLDLPSRPVEGHDGRKYCCHGCAHVDEIVSTVGADSEHGRKALEAAKAHNLVSTPDYEEAAIELDESLREESRLHIKGLACPSCGWLIEKVLLQTDGVAAASVDYYSDSALVTYDLSKCDLDRLVERVKTTGYGAEEFTEDRSSHSVKEWVRLAFAFFIAMNQMMLAWVGYDVIYPGSGQSWEPVVAWLQLLSALPVVVWCALPLYKKALSALRRGTVVMETLLSLGIIASMVISLTAFFSHHQHMYFESATMLVALSLAGRRFEHWIKQRTSRSLTAILEFSPRKARLQSTNRFVALEELSIGEMIVIEAGETVPVDIVLREDGKVREGLLTGESHAVHKVTGSQVLAGSVVESGRVIGSVLREPRQSTAEVIKDRVLTALRRVDSGSRMADRLAQGFVPVVILVAIASFFLHFAGGATIDRAALIAVSVLVVSCPCAFGLAASSALSLAVLVLAREGILIKDPQVLELAESINEVYFDKTGTVTKGSLSIENIGWIDSEHPEMLSYIQAIELESTHPIGIALASLLPADSSVDASMVVEVVGMGITGTIGNKRYAVGKLELFDRLNRPVPSRPESASRVWFGLAGEVPAGFLDVADTIKAEARETIAHFTEVGMTAGLLSGDGSEITATIGGRIGLSPAKGDMKPEEKAAYVQNRKASGAAVAFVGDGFNDAPALAESTIGFAMSSGADLAMVTAPVVFTTPNLGNLKHFFTAAKKAKSILVSNFSWAFVYNILTIPVAAMGYLLPIHAALLMALSSASVALNSIRIKKGFSIGRSASLQG